MLEDDHEVVRENACWALGYLGSRADAALDRLEACRTDDEHADVRTRAQWAIAQIETDQGV